MPKRPLGLAKAFKLKKLRQKQERTHETDPNVDAEQTGFAVTDVKPSLEVDLDSEPEIDEELAELYGLFSKMESIENDNDVQKLSRGIIHEADAILRSRKDLPARFHLVYGLALLAQSKYQDVPRDDANSSAAFIKAALERLDTGLEVEKMAGLCAAKALALVEQLDNEMRNSGPDRCLETFVNGKHLIEQAQTLAGEAASAPDEVLTRALESITGFAASLDSLEQTEEVKDTRKRVFQWIPSQWKGLLDAGDNALQSRAKKGLGEYYLAIAAPLLDQIEDVKDNEDAGDDGNDAVVEQAKAALTSAIGYLDDTLSKTKPESYVEAAEAHISLGNLLENDSPEQQKCYSRAVRLLKKAQHLGAGSFQDLIETLE